MIIIIIPILIILILVLSALFIGGYIATVVIFKLIKALSGGTLISPLPNSIQRPLREAREYAKKIRYIAEQCPPGLIRDRLERTIQSVDEWLLNLNRLEQALGKLHVQHNLTRELRRTRSEIDQLRRTMLVSPHNENDVDLRALLESKKKQYEVLQELDAFCDQAELKIRKIASDLGTTHAEMLLVRARGDFNDNRFQRLDENLQNNLSGLRDMVAAMDEMGYSSSAAN